MGVSFSATGKAVDDFRVNVNNLGSDVHIALDYWIQAKERVFNQDLNMFLTPEQTIELYEKLGQYILDRNLTKTEEIA